jgi:HEAT repeat protein
MARTSAITDITAALQQTASDRMREVLCDMPGIRKTRTAIPLLLACLDDPAEGVRSSAAEALAKIGDPLACARAFARL